jgi:hypothetical protein
MNIDFNKDIPPELQPVDPELISLFKLLALILKLDGVPDLDIAKVWDLARNAYLTGAIKGSEYCLHHFEKKFKLSIKEAFNHGLDS